MTTHSERVVSYVNATKKAARLRDEGEYSYEHDTLEQRAASLWISMTHSERIVAKRLLTIIGSHANH
jgi:hypothetical protein